MKHEPSHYNLIAGMYAALFIEDLDDSYIERVLPSLRKARNGPYKFARKIAKRLYAAF